MGLLVAMTSGAADAGSGEVFGLSADWLLQGTYSAAIRLEDPHDGIINTPPSPKIPIPDTLKLPESNNYDDGDRNFAKGSLVNNRLSFLGELRLSRDDYGLMVRGDAFYDDVYRRYNDNDSPETINTTQQPHYQFTADAQRFDGRRARLLDAYVYGSWYLGDTMALNLRLGQQVTAWGESLFFSGIALAQGRADATKATVPGADVKSILLPTNQISAQLSVNDKLTLLGQYKLDFKPTELNPVGEFFSVADIIGPGAEFIYGIENPLYLSNLSDVNLLSSDLTDLLDLVTQLAGLPDLSGLTGPLGQILNALNLNLPIPALPSLPGTPQYLNVQRGDDIMPSDHGQWGLGAKYQLTPETNVGLYHLRYHNTTPAPVQNYGYAVLVPLGDLPPITTELLGIQVPVTYNIRYFDGIHLTAGSFSTTLFGANIGGELIWRDGIDILVDVDGGLLGPVPTPTRSKVAQGLLSGLYSFGPGPLGLWDSFTIVGETSYIHVADVDEACGPTSCSTDLTYTRDAWGYSFLFIPDKKNVFDGWDLQVPFTFAGVGGGHSSLLSGLGSLMGEGDYRTSVAFNFTRLQNLMLGISYNAFLGKPDFRERPYADRDYAAITARYNF